MDRHPRRRSRKALIWGGLLVIVGVVVGVVMAVVAFARLDDKVSDFYRIGAPDVTEVFFDSTGDYVVYDESLGIPVGGETPFEMTVTRTGSGLEVPVSASVDDISYDTADHSGSAVFEFSIPAVGTYEIATNISTESGLAQLAVGRSVVGDLLRGLVTAAVVGGGIVLLGVIVAIVGSIPRSGRLAGRRSGESAGRDRRSTERVDGSTEHPEGSRERASSRDDGHGRSPLERRADSTRADADERLEALEAPAPEPGVEPQAPPPPPPPPPPEQRPAPPPAPVEPVAVEPVSLEASTIEIMGVETSNLQVAGLAVSGLENSGLDVSGLDVSGLDVSGLDESSLGLALSTLPSLVVSDIEVAWPDSDESDGASLRP